MNPGSSQISQGGSEPTIFVVDDDPNVRRSIELSLSKSGFQVHAFDSAESFLDTYQPHQAGCIVLDICMPNMSGLDMQKVAVSRGWIIPIIFVTGNADVPMAVQAMQAGAFDFIEKPFTPQKLQGLIERAVEKDAEIRAKAAEKGEIVRRYELLTPREREVMSHMVAGRLTKQIAMILGVSGRTIEVHRANVMRKMEADSMAELVLLAVRGGVCDQAQDLDDIDDPRVP